MMKIDVRGMSCPQPVLMTKKEVDKSPSEFEVIVDNNTAKNNVERFLKNSGYSFSSYEENDDFILKATKK